MVKVNKNHRVANALMRIRDIADLKGVDVLQTNEIQRADREILQLSGWLQEIIKGWYMIVRPDVSIGDSSAWYANYWDFLSVYLKHRFKQDYCLSAESSLVLHVDEPLIPKQVIVIAGTGSSSVTSLLYDTSVMVYSDQKNFPQHIDNIKGCQVMSLSLALCKATPTYFKKNPEQAEIACRMIQSVGDLIKIIGEYNLKSAAGRLIGAYQFLGESARAKELEQGLKLKGIKANIKNPFTQDKPFFTSYRQRSPYITRIKLLWAKSRRKIIEFFPEPPRKSKLAAYLKQVENVYEHDAYNSLSIEGYKVTPELIKRVKDNAWDPDNDLEDQDIKNALVARGYYEAFQQVKKSVEKILKGADAGHVVRDEHSLWYQALFSPCVKAGILKPEQLYGYREDRVFIRGSRHTPVPKNAVVDSMEASFECMIEENHPGVRAVMGHYLFVYIHPYMDGNGRMSRFLMNCMLASGGYHWTVINLKSRSRYRDALRLADEKMDFEKFTKLIIDEMNESQEY